MDDSILLQTPSIYTRNIIDDNINKIISIEQNSLFSRQKESDKIYSDNVHNRISSIIKFGASSASASASKTGTKGTGKTGASKTKDVIYISDDEDKDNDKAVADKDKDKDKDDKCLKIPIFNHERPDNNLLSDIFFDNLHKIFPKIFKPDDPKISYEDINKKMIDNFNYKIIDVYLIKNKYNKTHSYG